MRTHTNKQLQTAVSQKNRSVQSPRYHPTSGNHCRREMSLMTIFISLLSTPHIFLFSLLWQLLERMLRQERQTLGMINYRHRHFLCQQCRLYSSPLSSFGFAFLRLDFRRLWSKKENKVGNGEAFMCAV